MINKSRCYFRAGNYNILVRNICSFLFFFSYFFCHFAFCSLELWLVRLSNIFILRFTVALPLIFPCVIMIIFCSNYLTEGAHSLLYKPGGFSWASSPWEFKYLDFIWFVQFLANKTIINKKHLNILRTEPFSGLRRRSVQGLTDTLP